MDRNCIDVACKLDLGMLLVYETRFCILMVLSFSGQLAGAVQRPPNEERSKFL
jgi:hypothetical protein